jgi:Na+-transporting NADH:ubiquinone oxidoreductase subunit NqrA
VERVNGEREIFVIDINLVTRLGWAGVSVPISAVIFNQPFEFRLAVLACAHEKQMLQEVRGFPLGTRKVPIAHVHDQADRHIAGVGSLFEHNIEAVLQLEIVYVVEIGDWIIFGGRGAHGQTQKRHQEKEAPKHGGRREQALCQ